MNKKNIQETHVFAKHIINATASKDKKVRSKLTKEFKANVRMLLQAAKERHPRSFRRSDEKAVANYFDKLLKIIVEGEEEERKDASHNLAALYTLTYALPTAEADLAKDLVETLRIKVEEAEEEIEVCPEELEEKDFLPPPKHIRIKKPEPYTVFETVSLSPDFTRFLREQHSKEQPRLHLLSKSKFEDWLDTDEGLDWLAEQGIDYIDATTEIYRIALHQAFEQYGEDTYCKVYCRPKNISMPGIQYGHRLLRLPFVFEKKKDFAESGIYDGPVGRLHAPDVDLEELVRRYVNALYLRQITIYNIDDISEDYINVYFAEQKDILDPDKLTIFREATKKVVTIDTLREFIRQCQEQGRDLTPDQVAIWLQSQDASTLKDEIKSGWASALAGVIPGAAPGLLEELEDASRFRELIIGLCVPNVSEGAGYGRCGPENAGAAYYSGVHYPPTRPWEIGDVKAITNEEKGPENFPDLGEGIEFSEAVTKRIDALSNMYDRAWRAIKGQLGEEALWNLHKDITYSGYEFKSVVSWLALGTLENLSTYAFNGGWAKPEGHRGATNVRAARCLRDKIEGWDLLISEKDVLKELTDPPVEEWTTSVFYDDNWEFRVNLKKLIEGLVSSYKEIIDALLSLTSAARITSPISEELEDEQVERLYRHWTEIFANFLRQYSAQRRIGKESRITVRLAPRTGKFEETPKPKTDEGQFDPGKILPSHPRMQTEQYMLEPIPPKYACNAYPTLFLREDLSLRVRHRGFGIGANLYSMSLLPEEEQTITIKSFKDTSVKTSESSAENIFEEQTDETSKDFATEMRSECERESSSQSEFNVSAKASASFLFGSASIETGYSSQSSSRSLAKNASNVNNRLASKLSAKRTVSVETKRTIDRTVEEHSELITERTVKNPNKGHTLTFHWFQMTRKLATELRLEDLKVAYTSGVHKWAAVFGNGTKRPTDVSERDFRFLPDDIGRKLPPNTIIVVCYEPYTEIIPMSNLNVFLTRIFKEETARNISAMLWQLIGSGDPAPEGYGIAAFCDTRRMEPQNCKYISVTDPSILVDQPNGELVPADEIYIKEDDKTIYLPDIDLRYKREDGIAPTRYSADEFDAFSLPRTLLREEQVINTNGVFCDAMIGQCSALEDYLQRHRDLDLLEKKIEVGGKELDFKWALAKDGMVEVKLGKDDTIIGIVKEKVDDEGFKERLEIESSKRAEEKKIYNEEIEKKKRNQELKLLEQQVAELTKRIEQIGQPIKYLFDVPKDTKINIDAHINPEKKNRGQPVDLEVKESNAGNDE